LILGTNLWIGAQPAEKLPPLNVTKDKVVFDPKTAKIGDGGGVTDGCSGVGVQIVGRKDGKCQFAYNMSGCGGCQAFYRGEVPLDGGLVTIDVFNGGIRNSFPDKHLTLVRTTGPYITVLVEGTGEFVTYYHSERRSEMTPRKGDKVKLRFQVYNGQEFKQPLPSSAYYPTVEFVVGSGKHWPWLEVAMEEMTVGDRRQISVPVKIAEGAKKWLPAGSAAKVLYLEMSLISVERAK
jgi:hypothetical protein